MWYIIQVLPVSFSSRTWCYNGCGECRMFWFLSGSEKYGFGMNTQHPECWPPCQDLPVIPCSKPGNPLWCSWKGFITMIPEIFLCATNIFKDIVLHEHFINLEFIRAIKIDVNVKTGEICH
jgi:hypothetical protein